LIPGDYGLLKIYHSLRIIAALMMEAVSSSETSVIFYETARRNIPEDSRLRLHT
jgi:hypothetical protein